MRKKGFYISLGIREYGEILSLQKRINSARQQDLASDTVLFLEHYPCITIGTQGRDRHILANEKVLSEKGISVYETDRGGDVTYHGPGQLVCYPIIDLNNIGRDVLEYARKLEEMVMRTLGFFGISSYRKEGHPGVWVDNKRKIAAQGISVQRWVTMHGTSLNVSPMMDHFSLIVPCGLKGYEVVSMKDILGREVDMSAVISEMIRQISELFEIDLEEVDEKELVELVDYAKT